MVAEPPAQTNLASYGGKFCELFGGYQPALRRLVSAYVANSADREDLLQEIAAGIWKSLPGFRGESSERTWIYRIAHNIAIRRSSQVRARTAREPGLENSFDHPSGERNAEDGGTGPSRPIRIPTRPSKAISAPSSGNTTTRSACCER